MKSLALRDGGVGVALVVGPLDVELAAVDGAGAVGGVVEPGLEAFGVGVAVGGERAGLAREHRDLDRRTGVGRSGVAAAVAVVGAHPTSAMVAAAMTAVARYFFVTRM